MVTEAKSAARAAIITRILGVAPPLAKRPERKLTRWIHAETLGVMCPELHGS